MYCGKQLGTDKLKKVESFRNFSHWRKVEVKRNFSHYRKVEGNSNLKNKIKRRRKQQSKCKEIAIFKINVKVEGNSNFEIAISFHSLFFEV